MKNLLIILLMLIVSITGCDLLNEEATPTPTPSSICETPTPTATDTPQPGPSPTPPELSMLWIHFIDVGQGDAILIDLNETEVLIDGGGRGSDVSSYLEDYVDGPLEAMIATHPHADHIGGLIEVLNTFDVEMIFRNGDTSTTKTFSDFSDAIDAEEAQWVFNPRRDDTISIQGLTFEVLHPVEPIVDDTNNNSIVLRLSYGDIDFLFTGDAEVEAEESMIEAGVLSDVDILKIGHHGSRTSSSPTFLDIIKPEIAIYSAGEGNRYGHPHQETMDTLNDMGIFVLGTEEVGTITVTTDGVNPYTTEWELRDYSIINN